ncbi:DUF6460 domain-containing protein [Pseudahrensia aquimaris]|uniref:DUF6460 domain-containing protein n=1 Tax=Pseudahrensia aquimaris TaxID=744461 RepID=A0ABW3FHJ2_9HYPH
MSNPVTRFLGDTPTRVAVKLIVLSLIVGFVMNFVGWRPRDIFNGIVNFFRNLWELGFQVFANSLEYLLLGAAVVVPAFFIIRLLNFRSGSRD